MRLAREYEEDEDAEESPESVVVVLGGLKRSGKAELLVSLSVIAVTVVVILISSFSDKDPRSLSNRPRLRLIKGSSKRKGTWMGTSSYSPLAEAACGTSG